jgi:hypothetical protein
LGESADDTLNMLQGACDTGGARSAPHPRHWDDEPLRPHLITNIGDVIDKLLGVECTGRIVQRGFFGCKVNMGSLYARKRLQCMFNPGGTASAGHATDWQIERYGGHGHVSYG